MKEVLIIFFTSCIISFIANAKSFEFCSKLSNDSEKSSCYEELATSLNVQKPDALETKNDSKDIYKKALLWRTYEKKSKLSGRTDVYMYTISSDTQPNSIGRPETSNFGIRCMDNTTAVWIESPQYVSQNWQKVKYAFNDGSIKLKSFNSAKGGDAIGLFNGKSSIPFVKSMFGKDKLVVQFSSYKSAKIEYEFPITGLEEAIKLLRKACNW